MSHSTGLHPQMSHEVSDTCQTSHYLRFVIGLFPHSSHSVQVSFRIRALHYCVYDLRVLQDTARHLITLQHTATHCNTLQHTASLLGVWLPCTAPRCNTLQHIATHCFIIRSTTSVYSTRVRNIYIYIQKKDRIRAPEQRPQVSFRKWAMRYQSFCVNEPFNSLFPRMGYLFLIIWSRILDHTRQETYWMAHLRQL